MTCRYWYYPYGELWTSTCAEKDARKFTGKERDPESGLDYFGARYYASVHGRFTSVDPAVWAQRHVVNPQKWNRFSYVLNNPLKLVDPDGREEITFVVRTFIPSKTVSVPGLGTFNGGTKTVQAVRVETDGNKRSDPLISHERATGITEKFDSRGNVVEVGQSSGETLRASASRDPEGNVTVTVSGNESNPLGTVGAFSVSSGITYSLALTLAANGSYALTGTQDGFPSLKATVVREDGTQVPLYSYDPGGAGQGASALFPIVGDVFVNQSGSLPPRREQ